MANKPHSWMIHELIRLCLQISLACSFLLSPIPCRGATAPVEMVYGNSSSSVPMRVGLGAFFTAQSSQSPQVLISNNGLFSVYLQQWQDPAGNANCMAGVAYAWKTPGVMWSFTPQPVLGRSCALNLSSDGVLSLQYDRGVAWRTNASGSRPAHSLTLRDDGNLVLEDIDDLPLWQSFNETSFFFVPAGKHFTKNDTLFERLVIKQTDDFSMPGNFGMRLSHDSARLLLFLRESMFVYHSVAPTTQSLAVAEYMVVGNSIDFYDSKESLIGSIAANQGTLPEPNTPRSAFLHDTDGELQINYLPKGGGSHILYYASNLSFCEQPFSCDEGQYKLCNLSAPTRCSCPLGFEEDSTKNCVAMDASYSMLPIPVVFHPQLSPSPVGSQDECKVMCDRNETCNAALFDSYTKSCSLFPVLFNIVQGTNSSQVMFLKIQPVSVKRSRSAGPIIGAAIGVSLLLSLACAGLAFVIIRRRQRKRANQEELFLHELPRLPPRFSYRDLQVATKGFTTKLGAGAFGSVYEGVLASNGVKVAVKKLDRGGAAQNVDQFRAEVATIGSTSHVNLVILRGFCMEGVSRLLVYEFMARGSLDRWLFNANQKEREGPQVLDWETRYKIALHTARGLEYLHHECADRIVHCDVKPENILLDEKFNAKVADFGLAKLIGADDQSFAMTTLKGTRGYLAPEWLHNTTITAKSDVYSYGVVLLELISGQRSLDPKRGHLPNWALSIACGRTSTVSSSSQGSAAIDTHQVEAVLLDEHLRGQHVPTDELEQMLLIALSCVNVNPEMRPTMEGVVKMLERLKDVGHISQVHSLTQAFLPGLYGISEDYAWQQSTISDASNQSHNNSSATSHYQEPLSEVQAR